MTTYYVQIINDGFSTTEAFWSVDKDVARRIDVVASELTTHYPDPGEEMMTTLRKRFAATEFQELQLAPGEYYPRMTRPSSILPESSPGRNPDDSPEARNARTTSTGQLHALIGELEQICRVVHPVRENFGAFGHEIRNIIIIASTEVEVQWKYVLKENGAKHETTHDYVKLSPAMKLGEYRVVLTYYPWLDPIAPFENWLPSGRPTKDLQWYDAYNHIKHDREENFAQATLLNALKSLTGCFVMLCAQYGWDFALQGDAASSAFFRLIEWPKWKPCEIYVPPFASTLKKRSYPFPK